MPDRPHAPISLSTMFLWVAVCAVLLANLRIVAVTYREDVIHIWRDLTGTHRIGPTPLRWSDTPGPPPTTDTRGHVP